MCSLLCLLDKQDAVEIKKDTERIDELKAMKRAWEEAEPGRMAKAWQSRMKYLNSHMIKVCYCIPTLAINVKVTSL